MQCQRQGGESARPIRTFSLVRLHHHPRCTNEHQVARQECLARSRKEQVFFALFMRNSKLLPKFSLTSSESVDEEADLDCASPASIPAWGQTCMQNKCSDCLNHIADDPLPERANSGHLPSRASEGRGPSQATARYRNCWRSCYRRGREDNHNSEKVPRENLKSVADAILLYTDLPQANL